MALVLLSACGLHRPLVREEIGDLGRFEFRKAAADSLDGVVIGVPHGGTDHFAVRLARRISDRSGAGLVVAYGFKSKKLGVSQPVANWRPNRISTATPSQRGSVFREYRRILHGVAAGHVKLYVGLHGTADERVADRIEVATSGLTFEEARALKELYRQIRHGHIGARVLPALPLVIEPLDNISWRVWGIKHHGVLLLAEKGINVRLPDSVARLENGAYAEILSRWINEAIRVLQDPSRALPQIDVEVTEFGKFELIGSRGGPPGAVIGAPHGSYDEYTAELVKRLSYRTRLPAVIAKGFTPTETGGSRINVNRPTEKIPQSEGFEFRSRRAGEVYERFKHLVFTASDQPLALYIDVHQYNRGNKIQVASVGLSAEEAHVIKRLYESIRDRIVRKYRDVPPVPLVIEPLDQVEIGAWAAKREGLLGVVRLGLHFELPSGELFTTGERREIYTQIVAELLAETVPFLLRGDGATTGASSEEKGVY